MLHNRILIVIKTSQHNSSINTTNTDPSHFLSFLLRIPEIFVTVSMQNIALTVNCIETNSLKTINTEL